MKLQYSELANNITLIKLSRDLDILGVGMIETQLRVIAQEKSLVCSWTFPMFLCSPRSASAHLIS
jgi:hypothetical protein